MPERTAILNSIQSLRAMRKEFTARFDKLEDELLRLLETQPEASPPLPHSNSPEEWLTAREVYKALKISASTLYAKNQIWSIAQRSRIQPQIPHKKHGENMRPLQGSMPPSRQILRSSSLR